MSEAEEWKRVAGHEEYGVSSLGRVRSPRCGVMSLNRRKDGYLSVCLCDKGKVSVRYVHHLVLEAFVGPRPQGHVSRHLNGRRDDNRLGNLAWGTRSENEADKLSHGTYQRGDGAPSGILSERQVRVVKKLLRKGALSQREIGILCGVSESAIGAINRGQNWSHVKEAQA